MVKAGLMIKVKLLYHQLEDIQALIIGCGSITKT